MTNEFRSKAWRRFEQELQKLGLKYERRFKVEYGFCELRSTVEFWVPATRSYGKCTHVFFTARHPKQALCASMRRNRRTSFSVLAMVDGNPKNLRSAYWNCRFEAGKF